jgi:hypothetical protein
MGKTIQGELPMNDPMRITYAHTTPQETDNGFHPQNVFRLLSKGTWDSFRQDVKIHVDGQNLFSAGNIHAYNGINLVSRYQDGNNFYVAGIRMDGNAVIKKKVGGTYYTLATKQYMSGTYNAEKNPSLIKDGSDLRLRNEVVTNADGTVSIRLYVDETGNGTWKLIAQALDNGKTSGAVIAKAGRVGIFSDFMDLSVDNYSVAKTTALSLPNTPATLNAPTAAPGTPPSSLPLSTLFSDSFGQYPDGLITNEYAYWNPNSSTSKESEKWEMTSGSLFAQGGTGWSGVPNAGAPNALSTNANNSSVFRLTTKEADFGNVKVEFDLLNQGLSSNTTTPAVDWDGVHVFLRYQSEYNLYYATINRRDNTVVIKKKIPGGPSNNGTYYDLSTYNTHTVPYNTWQHVTATVKNNADGSVAIQLFADGTLVASAVDNGSVGGAPITHAGKVGIRGDNANIKFKNFTVSAL